MPDFPFFPLASARRIGGGCICTGWELTTTGGERLFAKTHPSSPPDFFMIESAGLAWLRDGGAPVPEVVLVSQRWLVLEWVDTGGALDDAALGRAIAAMHASGADEFGFGEYGYVGEVEVPNGARGTWPEFWVECRIEPVLRMAVDAGALPDGGARAIERVCARAAELLGPPEPPARLHGDLWAGNVLAGRDGRPWFVDPSAHGGHREVDLAMLALFGGLRAATIGAYDEAFPLADGWRERVPLFQLHPLLVHAVLFGGGYGAQAVAAARSVE